MRRGIALLMCTALILGVFGGLDLKFNLNLITPETVETEAATFAGKKMTNTYLLSVVTGSTAANGKIMFIAIDYYCKDGNQNRKCTEYIFPTEDSLYQSYYTALSVSQTDNTRPSPDKLASKASNSTGVTIKDINQYYGNSLAANSCNDFLLFSP